VAGRWGPGLGAAGETGEGETGVAAGVGGTKPIWGEVVWGEGLRDGGSAGSTTGEVAGAAGASALSFSRVWRARVRARRVASRRYWSLEKGFELMDAECPR